MTPDQLAAIKRRSESATEGPWSAVSGGGFVSIAGPKHRPCEIAEKVLGSVYGDGRNQAAENYIFMAHCREDVPALLEEIDRLQALVVGYRDRSGV